MLTRQACLLLLLLFIIIMVYYIFSHTYVNCNMFTRKLYIKIQQITNAPEFKNGKTVLR